MSFRNALATSKAVTPLRVVLRDRRARRVASAFTIFNGAEYAVWVALMVYSYQRGGATESGLVALGQLLPAAALAPLTGVLAERYAPEKVLAYGYWTQSGTLALAAMTLAFAGPALLVYGLVMLMTIAITATRPAQALVTPLLVRSADELTALNVVTEWAAQGAIFVAPAIAGGLLVISGPEAVFGVFAVALTFSAGAVASVRVSHTPTHRERLRARSEIVAGAKVAVSERAVGLVLLVSLFSYITLGALDVITVALAIGRFGGTASSAAWMTATLGAGGVIGSIMGGWLVGRRLAPALAMAALEFGIALAVIGVIPNEAIAFAMLLAAGIGQAVVGIAGHSLLQRCAPTATVGRTFALREALYNFGLAAGSILASALIGAFGIETTLIVIGGLLPGVTLLRLGAVWRLDTSATVPIVELSLLRRMRIFSRMPGPALEGLARNAQRVTFAPGAYLMRQGEPGDRYLAIAAGTAEVLEDGETIATCSAGDGVGEIALLRSVPRTASVRSRTAVEALAISKADFLIAVTGHPGTHQTAEAIATEASGDERHRRPS